MNKMIPIGLFSALFLTACGGGSSGGGNPGPAPAPKYTWQVVHLYETTKNKVKPGCAIFLDLDDSSDLTQDRVIAAVIPPKNSYKVQYHDKDGQVVPDVNINSTDSGEVTIDSGVILDDGYATLEVIKGSLKPQVYSLSIQAEFLQNLVLNANVDVSVDNLQCYKGPQQVNGSDDFSDNAVNFEQLSGNNYYQTSYINKSIAGQMVSSKVPVNAPLNKGPILGSVLDLSDDFNVVGYSLIPKENIFDKTQDSGELNDTVTTGFHKQTIIGNTTNLVIDGQSSIDVIYNDSIYLWQPVESLSQHIVYNDDIPEFSQWALNLQYSANDKWEGKGVYAFNHNDISIPEFKLFDFSRTYVSNGTINIEGTQTDVLNQQFNIQRTKIKALTDENADYFQTIISKPTDNQVFMINPNIDLVTNQYEAEVSFGNMGSNSAEDIKYFLNGFIDEANFTDEIRSDLTLLPNYYDMSGVVLTDQEKLKLYKDQMESNFTLIQNKVTVK